MSKTNFNIESGSGFSCPGFTLQQTPTSNMNPSMINLVSNHVIPASHPISTFGNIKPQSFKPAMQPLVPVSLPGGREALLGDVASQSLLGKRKSPTESTARGVLANNLSTTQKRMASMEHKPWLQSISEANKGTIQIQASSAFPRVPHLPSLRKSTVHLESVLSKPGKQVATTKQYVQKQPLLKPQNASFESVRSKIKESLASALALVQQQGESLKDEKVLPSKNPILPVESQVDSQSHESAISTSELDATVSEYNSLVLSSQKECFNQNESNKQTMTCETSVACKKSDSKNCDGQDAESIYPFPLEDISFSNDVLGDDGLLQGDLSWVLDSEIVFGDERDSEVSEAVHSDEAKREETGRKLLQDPQLLAFKIEAELFRLFGGVNKKYKEKGRSLLFNLKDKNNPELREKVMYGDIPPERLCSMSAEELASKELSEWRQAKAEKMAQMVVLRDTEVDIRRLVRKTHKGEFQVDVEQVDGVSMEVSVGSSSLSWSQLKNDVKRTSATRTGQTTGNENKPDGTNKTVTSTDEASDPMQGITVDDDIKDAVGVLPPIVSLDEFMESLDSEPPVGNFSVDAGKEATFLDKSDTENDGTLKSLQQTTADPIDLLPAESGSVDAGTSKMDSDIKSPSSDIKPKTSASVVIPTWDHVWEGVLQLSVSSSTSVTSFFKSGERTSAKEWPGLLEIKGRVRLNAFEKFLQELPKSRSRAVMVMYFVCKEDSPQTGRSRLYEEAESYDSEGRVGYVEPAAEVELYLCPTTGKTADILGNIVPKDQIDFFKSSNNALIGVVVWRRRPELTTASINHKHNIIPKTQPHKYGYMNHQDKDINVAKSISMSTPMSHHHHHHHHRPVPHPIIDNDEDDDDDDVPPGFGPGDVHRDDDDLPEFNFASQAPVRPSQSVNQARELINRYGRPKPSWNNVDDDDDDMPEWQPQARLNNVDVRMQQRQQQGAWWAQHSRSRRGF